MKTYTPTQAIANAAKKALKWKEAGLAKGAGTPVGWTRANQLANKKPISLDIVKRMFSYLSRHSVDKKGKDFSNNDKPSKGRVMWEAWGGDPAFKWTKKILNSLKKETAMSDINDKQWYGCRPVLNPLDIIKWARENGFKKCYAPTDMHVTFCYSKESFSRPDYETPKRIYLIPTKEHREFEIFGENKDTNVITFKSDDMTKSHNLMRKHGASFDFPVYTPHISFSNEVHDSPKAVVPYYGPIVLGKEKWDVIKSDWKPKEIEEASSAPLMPIDLAEFMATAMTCKTCKTLVSGIKSASDKTLWSKCLAYAEKKMNQYPKGYSIFYAAKLYTDKGGKC